MSLQEYLSALLDEVASRPSVEEVLRRAGEHATGRIDLGAAAALVRSDRDER